MDKGYAVVLTTVDSAAAAERLTAALLDARLAACIQQLAVSSTYVWQNERCQGEELLLLIKTRRDLYPQIEALLRTQHPYELPEIIMLPITAALPAYLNWIDETTASGTQEP